MNLREFVKGVVPATVKRSLRKALFGYDAFAPSFSAAGEDMILRYLLGSERCTGFYIDIGGFDPVQSSNTFFFYTLGWRGINIDARPGSMAGFDRVRPHDTNIEIGIGSHPGMRSFYIVDAAPSMHTFSREFLDLLNMSRHISREVTLEVRRLDDVLAEHVPADTAIDFMTIDVEGAAHDVIASNDWDRFRPTYVLIEDEAVNPLRSEILGSMGAQDYRLVGLTPVILDKVHNFVFVDARVARPAE